MLQLAKAGIHTGCVVEATGYSFPTPSSIGVVMQVDRADTAPASQAPEDTFTGDVRISGYFRRPAPSRLSGATVTFAPGPRTPWKVNPMGQTLVITSGTGWAQGEGEDIVEVRAGDMIWCPPGQRHWEGATPDTGMSYVAIQEESEGKRVEFGAEVSDDDYRKGLLATSSRQWTGASGDIGTLLVADRPLQARSGFNRVD